MPKQGNLSGPGPQQTESSEPDPEGSSSRPAAVRVELGARSYDILVGSGLLAEAGQHLGPILRRPRVAIVTDEHVAAAHHLATLTSGLDAKGIRHDSIIL